MEEINPEAASDEQSPPLDTAFCVSSLPDQLDGVADLSDLDEDTSFKYALQALNLTPSQLASEVISSHHPVSSAVSLYPAQATFRNPNLRDQCA